jgi:hypothetical protein
MAERELSPEEFTLVRAMVRSGEDAAAIARVLGLSPRSAYAWCIRHGMRIATRKLAHAGAETHFGDQSEVSFASYRARRIGE